MDNLILLEGNVLCTEEPFPNVLFLVINVESGRITVATAVVDDEDTVVNLLVYGKVRDKIDMVLNK